MTARDPIVIVLCVVRDLREACNVEDVLCSASSTACQENQLGTCAGVRSL